MTNSESHLKIKQTEIFAVFLFEHLKQVCFVFIAAPIAVLIIKEQVVDSRRTLLGGQDRGQNSLGYITQLVLRWRFGSIMLRDQLEIALHMFYSE